MPTKILLILFSYFFGDLGGNFSFDLVNMYMFIYFTQFIGIKLAHYGTIILIAKILDAINDPIIGHIIDRVQLKTKNNEKFKPWIIRTAPFLAFSMSIMFIDASNWSYGARLALFACSYIIWDILYTFVNVPYGALSSVMTREPAERTALSTARSIGGFTPNILYGIFIPVFIYKDIVVDGAEKSVFQGQLMFPITIVTGILAVISYYILYKNTEERVVHVEAEIQENEKTGIVESARAFFTALKNFFQNRAMMALSLIALAQILFLNGSQQLTSLTFQMYFGDGRLNSYTIILTLIPMVIGATFGNHLVRRYGKKEICSYPLLISVGIDLIMLLVPIKNPFVWLGLMAISRVFSFGLAIYTWALVADAIDYQEWKTGDRNEGTMYSMYSMMRKMGQGLGSSVVPFTIALLLPTLDLSDAATWSMETAAQIKNLSVIFPMLGHLIIFFVFTFVYHLDKKTLEKIEKDLGNI